MHMDQTHPTTGEQRKIFDLIKESEGSRYFVISGDHIANIILDTSPGVSELSDEEIDRIIQSLGDDEKATAEIDPASPAELAPER